MSSLFRRSRRAIRSDSPRRTEIRHADPTVASVAILGSQMLSVAVPPTARPYLPGTALQAAVTGRAADDLLSPLAGLGRLGAYSLASLLAAVVLVASRARPSFYGVRDRTHSTNRRVGVPVAPFT